VRRLKKKVIASALALVTLLEPMLPMVQTSQALADIQSFNDNTLQVYLDAVQSAKERGVLFAIYDPYGKRLKMYHYWVAVGNPTDDKLTNTQCGVGAVASINIIGALRLKDPKRRVDSYDIFRLGYNCSDKQVGDKTLRYCTSNKGSFYYDTDGSVVNVTPINGFVCRRQVNDEALREAHVLVDDYDPNNSVISKVGQYDAAKIVAKYAYYHKIQYALFIVETFDVKTDASGSLKKKITYHYYEVPKYYGIVAGIGGGTPLGNGYYMVDGQGIGNLFDRSYNELFSKSQSGWTFISALLVGLLMVATGSALGVGALTFMGGFNMAVTTLQNVLNGTNFFNQPWFIPVEKDKGSANRIGINPTPSLNQIPKFVEKEHISKDNNVITGDGASQITEKLISGSEYNQTLKGFKEPAVEKDTYQGWKKAPGGFIQLPSQ
jgi:hypothetical protein